ncbi:RNA polymerase sigma factor [Mangrovihabitans endophyticus]|uniref:RNA polymerase sigma-70 factor, ECF subfamily n=1 Tax=Mangrovihabitans endophyticus TaxID=1751298 RepID=A0A8J3BVT7_9ACTN|nr:sigma-70 family RNA polymerase sigma factor [Mangrovihabitans endophyticus]GGK81941.1 hypothetical protein GCM10012284_14990 [Mangrovihabitans endophyticus]
MSDDVARFGRIYDANYDRLLGYALRRTDSQEDAADVVAETFLTAWRRLADVPEDDEARLWLYGVARRVLANHHRGLNRYRRVRERLSRAVAPMPPEPAPGEQATAITAAFRRLSELDRELLLLVGWEGLDMPQIGSVLGCTPATARVRLHRARARFARELARQGVGGVRRITEQPTVQEAL